MKIDNNQCLSAIAKGYSKKLRHIGRTQRVCVGLLHELTQDPELMISAEHCSTDKQKGDLFTKTLIASKFENALQMIGMKPKADAKK